MRVNLERLLISEAELLEITGFDRQKILQSAELTPRQMTIYRAIAVGITAITFVTFASIFLPALRITGIILLISLTLGALSLAIEFAEVAILCFCLAILSIIYSVYILLGATWGLIWLCLALAIAVGLVTFFLIKWVDGLGRKSKNYNRKNEIPPIVMRLFAEVDKCNTTIHDITLHDRLKKTQNSIKLEARESAIAALRMTRNEIVRALKTERILREQPDFHSNFQSDLFDIDLKALAAIQVRDRNQEYKRIFDITLQIASNVRQAMSELMQELTQNNT